MERTIRVTFALSVDVILDDEDFESEDEMVEYAENNVDSLADFSGMSLEDMVVCEGETCIID